VSQFRIADWGLRIEKPAVQNPKPNLDYSQPLDDAPGIQAFLKK
jgi:hypothetical protein